MAVLESPQTRVVLRARHLIGRSRAADTRIPAGDVSGEHAVFRWTGQDWELRDLGSRNGTWLDARQLQPGERATVRAGEQIAFGNPGTCWLLASDAAPSAAAVSDAAVHEAQGEFLALPSLDDPQAILELDPDQGWLLIRDGESLPARHGQTLELDGVIWRVSLPCTAAPVPMTAELAGMAELVAAVADRGLHIAVSADEEYLEVQLRIGQTRHALPPRVHHELLLALARQRLADREQDIAESEAGWVYTSDLRKMLGVSANQFYVMSHRCKRELEELGLDGAQVLEKRRTSHQVRIGLSDLSVRSL